MTTRSISKQSTASVGTGCAVVTTAFFALIFGGAAVTIAYSISGAPLLNLYRAQSWQPAECQITFSGLLPSGSKGTSRIDIQYRYVWNDRTYTGGRYDFTVGSDNFNNSRKLAIIARHRPGQTVGCFVDPNDPTHSVINREMRWGYLFGAAFAVPFALVPGLIFWVLTRARAQSQARVAPLFAGAPASTSKFPTTTPAAPGAVPMAVGGPVVLKPEVSRIGRLIGMIFLCLFWNGIVGFFTYMEFRGYVEASGPMSHGMSWFLTLFLIPFQLIGLFLVWGVVSSVLGLANPKPTLTLSAASVPVGGSMTLQWQMSGAAGRLRNLRIFLRGREEAHYRRGTNSYTDKHTFYETQLVEATDTPRIERGMATVTIPANTMHSFASSDNKIIWSLQVKGEIGFWPDVDETFDLIVRPRSG